MRTPDIPVRSLATGVALVVLLAFGPAFDTRAEGNEDCLMCHEDSSLTGVRNGREISVHVDAAGLEASAHAGFDCVTCHQDLDGAEIPHDDDLGAVDCAMCHDEVPATLKRGVHRPDKVACASCHGSHTISKATALVGCDSCHATVARKQHASVHGEATTKGDPMAPTCKTCHGGHEILAHTDPRSPTNTMAVPMLCGTCHREGTPVTATHEIHQDNILENYSMSIHGEGLFKKGLAVTAVCTSCHTSHDIRSHLDPTSSINRTHVAETCTACHSQIEQVHRKVIEGRLWEEEPHKIPSCVDCHAPHKIRRVVDPQGMGNQDCMKCHGDPELIARRDGEVISLYVDEARYLNSAHAEKSCAQCHTGVSPSKTRSCETLTDPVDCSICHAEVVTDYRESIHGTLHAAGDADAPTCLDCHDKHSTQLHTIPTSPTFARNVPALCARCHREGEKAAVRILSTGPEDNRRVDNIVQSYEDSIHGKGLLRSGLIVTATCTNCHTTHRELPPADPRSSVNSDHVADTCGSCHHGIEEVFKTSVHWKGNTKTDRPLPTCEDCHTSHTIGRTDMADFRMLMMEQCGRCHEGEAETFFDTYHGKVSRLGAAGAAKCYDCHGTHAILPPDNPKSALSRENVVDTCANCHEGAHRRFAGYLTHATHHDVKKYPWLFWTFWGMTALLAGTLSFGMIHTGAWLFRLWRTREEWIVHKHAVVDEKAKVFRRFTSSQRTMHVTMILSFFTLSLTGMALKFSYMRWARGLSTVLGGFDTMGVLHRIGAIVLITIFGLHVRQVVRKRRDENRTWKSILTGWDTILFTKQDLLDLWGSIKWFFGRGVRPKYGRYTYWEKFDYFAVFWGVGIIGGTGMVLWFPELFTYVLPGWSVNVATIIHSDEALLATAFIFTVHFFNTHFRPDKFPMDPVIFTGRVPIDEYKHDKPAEWEELERSGQLEKHLVDPMPKDIERGFKIFGFVALTIGLTLVALIAYSMIFGYR